MPATAWWDTALPGGFLRGTSPGAQVIRDWSGGHHHAFQVTAAKQGAISRLGPGGQITVTSDPGAPTGWLVGGATFGAGTDYTVVVGIASISLPSAGNTCAFTQVFVDAAHYGGLGLFNSGVDVFVSVLNFGVNSPSSLVALTGIHSYAYVCDGAAGTAWCYLDGVKAAATVLYTPIALTTKLNIGADTVVYSPPNGAYVRASVWMSKLTDAQVAQAAAWSTGVP